MLSVSKLVPAVDAVCQVFAHLKEQGADMDLLWKQIKEICVKTCLAVANSCYRWHH